MIKRESLEELKEISENNREEVLKKSDAWLDCLKKLGYGLLDK
jgi:hypothetical protein